MIDESDFIDINYSKYKADDNVFLKSIGLTDGTREASAALAIRQLIAEYAGVCEGDIWAQRTFSEDLTRMGMWDSLDTVEFVMELEDRLQTRIPDAVAERLPGLMESERINPSFCVRDMVLGIISTLKNNGIF